MAKKHYFLYRWVPSPWQTFYAAQLEAARLEGGLVGLRERDLIFLLSARRLPRATLSFPLPLTKGLADVVSSIAPWLGGGLNRVGLRERYLILDADRSVASWPGGGFDRVGLRERDRMLRLSARSDTAMFLAPSLDTDSTFGKGGNCLGKSLGGRFFGTLLTLGVFE